MTIAPVCPDCGRVEWLGDGILVTQEHTDAVARRLTLSTKPERRWTCIACRHVADRPSALDDHLESIADAQVGEPREVLSSSRGTR